MASWLRADLRRFDVAVAVLVPAGAMTLLYLSPDRFDIGGPEWAAGVGAFVLLLARRRAPLVLLGVALVAVAVHIGLLQRPTPMIFVVLVLLATACVRLERWKAIGLGLSVAISLYVLGLISNDVELGDARVVIWVAWTAGAVGIADAVRSWRSYRASADAQIRSAVLASEAQARQQVSEERLAIARELHDLLAHNLAVMNVQNGAALHLLRSDPDQAEQSLIAARDAGRSVLDELRELLSVLRHDGPNGDDADTAPVSSLPTFDDVERLVETMRSAGLTVNWRRDGSVRSLAPAVSLAAYRIVQEALTNAAKHGVGVAELTTSWSDDGLRLSVVNAASAGSPADGAGLGLIGMRERASANGGRLEAGFGTESTDTAGMASSSVFTVQVWLPTAADEQVGLLNDEEQQ